MKRNYLEEIIVHRNYFIRQLLAATLPQESYTLEKNSIPFMQIVNDLDSLINSAMKSKMNR